MFQNSTTQTVKMNMKREKNQHERNPISLIKSIIPKIKEQTNKTSKSIRRILIKKKNLKNATTKVNLTQLILLVRLHSISLIRLSDLLEFLHQKSHYQYPHHNFYF